MLLVSDGCGMATKHDVLLDLESVLGKFPVVWDCLVMRLWEVGPFLVYGNGFGRDGARLHSIWSVWIHNGGGVGDYAMWYLWSQ